MTGRRVANAPFFADYAQSLKAPCAEELVDLAFFRPLGYLFVKFFLPFPVTPNQVSMLAMAFGIAAGSFLAHGTPIAFMIGGTLYGLSNVLDCCDGMLARIKKNGAATGRIVDGIVDYVTAGAVFTGLGIGLTRAVHRGTLDLPAGVWILVAVAGVSTALHAICSDYFRNAYLDQRKAPRAGDESELERFEAQLARLTAGKAGGMDRILIRLYIGYLKLQSGNVAHRRRRRISHSSAPAVIKPVTVILWNLIGPSTHIAFFMLASFFYRPMIFFTFVIVAANAWTLFLLLVRIFGKFLLSTRRQI
jgi:CDP-alcohol phosphatidyltransferase